MEFNMRRKNIILIGIPEDDNEEGNTGVVTEKANLILEERHKLSSYEIDRCHTMGLLHKKQTQARSKIRRRPILISFMR